MLNKTQSRQRGFTLLELLIVIALAIVLVSFGFATFSQARRVRSLKSALEETAAVLRNTQARSVGQEGGTAWGVRFSNPADGSFDRYEVFSGGVYTASGVTNLYSFRDNVQFSSPALGGVVDVIFDPISGAIPSDVVVSLMTALGTVRGDVRVSALGRITYEIIRIP